ncbi:MAG: hypothetical protein PHW10_02870 [Candidatus Peribacteraceae bacterium]|nr:hypothetical protein [Candidatus Peribacteraceae bacterium]
MPTSAAELFREQLHATHEDAESKLEQLAKQCAPTPEKDASFQLRRFRDCLAALFSGHSAVLHTVKAAPGKPDGNEPEQQGKDVEKAMDILVRAFGMEEGSHEEAIALAVANRYARHRANIRALLVGIPPPKAPSKDPAPPALKEASTGTPAGNGQKTKIRPTKVATPLPETPEAPVDVEQTGEAETDDETDFTLGTDPKPDDAINWEEVIAEEPPTPPVLPGKRQRK